MSTAPALLEYASPRTRQPWRPILFRLSRRTIVMMLLTAAAIGWLALRHDPGRKVATIPVDYKDDPSDSQVLNATFTPEGHVLLFDTKLGVNRYDPATGKLIHKVLPNLDVGRYVYYGIGAGKYVLAIPH